MPLRIVRLLVLAASTSVLLTGSLALALPAVADDTSVDPVAPIVSDPGSVVPPIEVPPVTVPSVTVPPVSVPPVTTPQVTTPEVSTPGVTVPAVPESITTPPSSTVPSASPSPVPSAAAEESSPSTSESGTGTGATPAAGTSAGWTGFVPTTLGPLIVGMDALAPASSGSRHTSSGGVLAADAPIRTVSDGALGVAMIVGLGAALLLVVGIRLAVLRRGARA